MLCICRRISCVRLILLSVYLLLSVGCFLDICIDTCVSSLLGTAIHLSCIPVTTHKVHTSACCMRIDMFLSQDLVPPN